jgi:hypothetical protein
LRGAQAGAGRVACSPHPGISRVERLSGT